MKKLEDKSIDNLLKKFVERKAKKPLKPPVVNGPPEKKQVKLMQKVKIKKLNQASSSSEGSDEGSSEYGSSGDDASS